MFAYINIYTYCFNISISIQSKCQMKCNRVIFFKLNLLALSEWSKKYEMIHFVTFTWKISSKFKCSCRITQFQRKKINVILELNSVLLKHFRGAVGGAYLWVSSSVNLPFMEVKGTRHVKSMINFRNWPWRIQLHLKPESHWDDRVKPQCEIFWYVSSTNELSMQK